MCTWYLIPVGDAMMRTWLSGRCLDISGLILRLRIILTTTPTGPAPPVRIRGRRGFRALHACRDYRGHRDYRVRRGSAHVPIPEIDLTDLVPN